jgi:hypothetical protein
MWYPNHVNIRIQDIRCITNIAKTHIEQNIENCISSLLTIFLSGLQEIEQDLKGITCRIGYHINQATRSN